MLTQATQFLLETVVALLVFAALMRFYMQLFRSPLRNPLTQFVTALTDFAVRPLRRVIPGLFGYDLASLFFAWILQFVLLLLILAMNGLPILTGGPHIVPTIAFLALVKLLRFSLYLLMAALFIQVVMSWVNPYNPLAPLLDSLTRPFLRPVQKRLPPIGNVDLSPLVMFIVCQLILMVPVAWLEMMAVKLIRPIA